MCILILSFVMCIYIYIYIYRCGAPFKMCYTCFSLHGKAVYLFCRLSKVPLGNAGLSIIADGLKANPDCGIRRLGYASVVNWFTMALIFCLS